MERDMVIELTTEERLMLEAYATLKDEETNDKRTLSTSFRSLSKYLKG